MIFNVQSTYINYFTSMTLPFEQCHKLILYFSKKYDLEQSRTHLLLSELESLQTTQTYNITQLDK